METGEQKLCRQCGLAPMTERDGLCDFCGSHPGADQTAYTTATVECPPDRHLAPDVRLLGRGVRVSRCFACGIVLVD